MKYKQLKKALFQGNKINFAVAIFTMMLLCAANILTAFIFKGLSDIAIDGTMEELKRFVLATLLFIVIYVLISMWKTVAINRFNYKATTQYKKALFDKIIYKDINAFNNDITGKYISMMTNDVSAVESYYTLGNINIVYQIVLMITAVGVMLYLNWFLTICVLAAATIPLIGTALCGNKLSEREADISEKNAGFVGYINDIFKGFAVIKSFQAEVQIIKNFAKENKTLETAKKKRRTVANIINVVSLSASFIVTDVVCGVGVYLTLKGHATLGTVIAFIQLLDYVVNPIQELGPALANRKAAERLIAKAEDIMEEGAEKGNTDKIECKEFKNEITFSNVQFGYQEDQKILKSITTNFKQGESYAIVGPSGSGKTTLLHMILGYFDNYKGSIQIDGKELTEISSDSLHSLITIIQQNVFVFDDSIMKNVTMYKDFDSQRIDRAIMAAGLTQLVETKGSDYQCGENGKNLSGGEKQRVSIARAMLSNASILLADEATAALDTTNAQNVIRSILELKDMTRIVVTHSLNRQVLSQFDHIIVMKDGEIVDIGTFDELYSKKELFYSLVNVYE